MRIRMLAVLTVLLMLPMESFAAEKLVFAIDLIRHGDRTPVVSIPTVNYKWKEGLGQLTETGMQQEYALGSALRKRYVDETHLLPEHYQPGTIYIRSTDYDRTLMSAQSFLMGLYPHSGHQGLPNGFQPIPVHTAPGNMDTIILQPIDRNELEKIKEKYVYSTVEWQQKEAELKPYFKRWSEATGTEINALADLDVGDAVRIHKLYNAPLPSGLSEDDIKNIIAADDFSFVKEFNAVQVSAVYSQQVTSYIANTLQQISENDGKLKYVLLSAHDATIASVLSLLGAPATTTPPYASDLNFSMYESGNRSYIVRVTYNGVPVNIPGCAVTECTVPQFVAAANRYARLPDDKQRLKGYTSAL